MILDYLNFYLTGWACMACLHAAITGFNPEITGHKRFLIETLLWPYYLPASIGLFTAGFIKGFQDTLRKKNREK